MKKLDKETKQIILELAGKEIEFRDKFRIWLPYKDKEQETNKNLTRRSAITAYTKLRNI